MYSAEQLTLAVIYGALLGVGLTILIVLFIYQPRLKP